MTLLQKVLSHDWESDHWMELNDRIDILKDLCNLGQDQVAEILKKCTPRKVIRIVQLMEKWSNAKKQTDL